MILPKDIAILILFIVATIVLGTIALVNGIKRRDWFNIVAGVFSLLVGFYLTWGLLMIMNIL